MKPHAIAGTVAITTFQAALEARCFAHARAARLDPASPAGDCLPMQRVLSGIQPSGVPTLGNYLGAIRNWVALQADHDCLFCVVDLHALTRVSAARHAAGQCAGNDRRAAAPAASIRRARRLFAQSHVSAHARLAWIFNCVARLGWLNRMTQFKDKAGKDREAASVGLYVYPNLMAADIHTYHATRVPVGDDQRQHLELANDIAEKFNHDYGVDFSPASSR